MASLYLHIPYCEKKCVYCDFYSIENMDSMELFLRSLEKEIAMYAGKSTHPANRSKQFSSGAEHPPSFHRLQWKEYSMRCTHITG